MLGEFTFLPTGSGAAALGAGAAGIAGAEFAALSILTLNWGGTYARLVVICKILRRGGRR